MTDDVGQVATPTKEEILGSWISLSSHDASVKSLATTKFYLFKEIGAAEHPRKLVHSCVEAVFYYNGEEICTTRGKGRFGQCTIPAHTVTKIINGQFETQEF